MQRNAQELVNSLAELGALWLCSSADMIRDSLNLGLVGLLAAATLFSFSPSISAQSDEQRAAARQLATDGAAAFKQARWKEAVDLFSRAESLQHAPPHLLYLARAHEKLGELVKAREAYLKITRETLPPNAPQAFRDALASAEEELQKVEPRIASLTLSVQVPEGTKDAEVFIDGAAVPSALVGVSRPIDPGEHKVEARALGFLPRGEIVKLGEGERKSVVLALAPDPDARPAPSEAPAPTEMAAPPSSPESAPSAAISLDPLPPVSSTSSGKGMLIGSYVAYGVGAVGLGLGTFFAISSAGKSSDADTAYRACTATGDCRENDPTARRTRELDDDARSAKTLSIVGFALGGVGIGAGTALLLLGGKKSEERPAVGMTVRPFIGVGSAGVTGSF